MAEPHSWQNHTHGRTTFMAEPTGFGAQQELCPETEKIACIVGVTLHVQEEEDGNEAEVGNVNA